MILNSIKQISLIGLLTCVAVLAAAYYLEYQYMLATCPLCILQRIVFMSLGAIFFLGLILPIRKTSLYIYSGVLFLLACCGAGLALRQIWIQYFAPPPEVTCAASLEHLIDIYPFLDALKIALAGTGECATIDFTVLGLSLAVWSFILFAGFAIAALYLIYANKNK